MYDLVCCNIVTLVKLCAFVGSLVGVVMITKCTYALWESFEYISDWWRPTWSLIPWGYNF
jgi:hypothetical protein